MAKRKAAKAAPSETDLVEIHTRLFRGDLLKLREIAGETRLKWQVELRQLVHRALKNERREVLVLKEQR